MAGYVNAVLAEDLDGKIRQFIVDNNSHALQEIIARLQEATVTAALPLVGNLASTNFTVTTAAGGTTVNAGTLRVENVDGLKGSQNLIVADGGTFEFLPGNGQQLVLGNANNNAIAATFGTSASRARSSSSTCAMSAAKNAPTLSAIR